MTTFTGASDETSFWYGDYDSHIYLDFNGSKIAQVCMSEGSWRFGIGCLTPPTVMDIVLLCKSREAGIMHVHNILKELGIKVNTSYIQEVE